MPLVLGIDEAGYGPLLGPLVIAGTLWRVEPTAVRDDFWERLDDAVCRRPRRGESRLPVGDSKKIYDRKRGIATLERTILAFAQAAGLRTDTLRDFLEAVGFEPAAPTGAFPWYRDLGRSLPADPARSAHQGAAQRLRETMVAQGVTCCALRAQILTEDVFNQRVTRTRNKAAVLVEAILRLIHWAAQRSGDQDFHVLVDRLGGRANYRELLMRAFPQRHLHVLEVSERCSRYRLASQRTDWHVEFAVDGDQHCLPIALASMLAKYLREMLMERFNAYWHQLSPDLRPTAGYYRDARRFLTDISPLVDRAGVAPERFVRSR